jgi:hypothetical protein
MIGAINHSFRGFPPSALGAEAYPGPIFGMDTNVPCDGFRGYIYGCQPLTAIYPPPPPTRIELNFSAKESISADQRLISRDMTAWKLSGGRHCNDGLGGIVTMAITEAGRQAVLLLISIEEPRKRRNPARPNRFRGRAKRF